MNGYVNLPFSFADTFLQYLQTGGNPVPKVGAYQMMYNLFSLNKPIYVSDRMIRAVAPLTKDVLTNDDITLNGEAMGFRITLFFKKSDPDKIFVSYGPAGG